MHSSYVTDASACHVQKEAMSCNMSTRQDSIPSADDSQTTVMLRNLPNNYTREMLLELINSEGFDCEYDFVYLPIDFNSQAGLGYAFVNLVSSNSAQRFWKHFDGFCRWAIPSDKVCSLNWSSPHQGLVAHIQRYRDSPVMHEAVSDECKPMLFENGVRIRFPPPTKQLKAPRLRVRDSAKKMQR
jgi:RNA recognition motif-containing protein